MQQITLEFGEDRQTRNQIIKTYFFYVDKMGMERSLLTTPKDVLSKVSSRVNSNSETKREHIGIYDVHTNTALKMFSSKTTYGKPKENHSLILSLNEDAPMISLTGLMGFGKFIGRATITCLTGEKDTLKKLFSYTVIAPAVKNKEQGKDAPRKLLW